MSDLISRQAALDAIDKNRDALLSSGMTGAEHILVHYGRRVIEELPKDGCEYWDGESSFCALQRPADRVPVKRGEWIDGKYIGFDGCFVWHRECSLCGYEREDDNPDKDTPFCPICGHPMERSEE